MSKNQLLNSILINTEKASLKNDRYFYINPVENIEINTKTSSYENWSNWRKANFRYFQEKLSHVADGSLVLDIGAGPSQFRSLFERHTTISVDYYPYDLIDVIADITKPLPFCSDCFDVVVLSNVLEHVPNPRSLLKEAFRVLKPGGIVIATIPFLMRQHQQPYDFNRFTHFALHDKFSDFSNVNVIPLGSPMHVYDTMQRHFFQYLPDSLTKKIFYYLSRLTTNIMKRCYKNLPPAEAYTEGYGITAKKRVE